MCPTTPMEEICGKSALAYGVMQMMAKKEHLIPEEILLDGSAGSDPSGQDTGPSRFEMDRVVRSILEVVLYWKTHEELPLAPSFYSWLESTEASPEESICTVFLLLNLAVFQQSITAGDVSSVSAYFDTINEHGAQKTTARAWSSEEI